MHGLTKTLKFGRSITCFGQSIWSEMKTSMQILIFYNCSAHTIDMSKISMFNIRNGQNGGLELLLSRMEQGQVDCGFFQESKLTKIFYTRKASWFWVTATEAPSAHRGGFVIFYRTSLSKSSATAVSPSPAERWWCLGRGGGALWQRSAPPCGKKITKPPRWALGASVAVTQNQLAFRV